MDEIAKSLLRLTWADLAAGGVAAIILIGPLALLPLYRRWRARGEAEPVDPAPTEERQRLLLSCGDVRALTDLAIQRHMSDTVFLQRFQAQPSYPILEPHFSAAFRERLTHPSKHKGRADLAAACQAECERIEQLWQTP
jgi:hypothetical protein